MSKPAEPLQKGHIVRQRDGLVEYKVLGFGGIDDGKATHVFTVQVTNVNPRLGPIKRKFAIDHLVRIQK